MKLQFDWNSWVFDLATSLEHFLLNGRDMITVPPFTLCQCILAVPVYTVMPLECHWSTQCALGHHWATHRMLQGTLEHHWKNVVETALHWNNTEETLTITANIGTPLNCHWLRVRDVIWFMQHYCNSRVTTMAGDGLDKQTCDCWTFQLSVNHSLENF